MILASDTDYPACCRVVWNAHVREMTDLRPRERDAILSVVFTVEEVLRELIHPYKINLASLGNQVPHLHWHVIPRFRDDAHFPDSVWSARQRPGRPHPLARAELQRLLGDRLGAGA